MYREVEIMHQIEEKLYIIFDNGGTFKGFYTDLEIVQLFINDNTHYCAITKEIRNTLLSMLPNAKVKTELITNSETIIDSLEYIEQIPIIIDIKKIKRNLMKTIKSACGQFITQGNSIPLSTGESKDFSYTVEDQINLKAFVENHHSGDFIYYHAKGEFDTLYSYEDIVTIYKTLYNNKVYNQIYTQVLCGWLNKHYTLEMYEAKEPIIDYGYSNDEILKEVTVRYEQQKLS